MSGAYPIDTLGIETPPVDLFDADPYNLWYFALWQVPRRCVILEIETKDQVPALPHVVVVILDGSGNRRCERLDNICMYPFHVSASGYLLDLLGAVVSKLQIG